MYFNYREYLNKVRGAWLGKNAGGVLGAPFESMHHEIINGIEFYTQKDLKENPVPNDDLDLQLVWLCAAERNGLYQLTPQILGEYWINHIIGPWNEYTVCRQNIANGFTPPLSGIMNNKRWQNSNGAWIRSEIWALIFPGHPEEAVKFAWMDSCADHAGEGIYAEVFTCALEAAAFVEHDIMKLIDTGLNFIPQDCRTAKLIKIARDHYNSGAAFKDAWQAVVDANDLGWFQAPNNLAFMVLALLYGEGDFAKTLCTAVSCGDDTDCTAATAGAITGLIYGADALPEKWLEPLGDTIATYSMNKFGLGHGIPPTVSNLTERTAKLAREASLLNKNLAEFGDGPTVISDSERENLRSTPRHQVCSFSSLRLVTPVGCGEFVAEYDTVPEIATGETLSFRAGIQNALFGASTTQVRIKLIPPETWSVSPSCADIMVLTPWESETRFTVTAGTFSAPVEYIIAEISISGRNMPYTVRIPVQQKDTVRGFADAGFVRDHWRYVDFLRRGI